MTTGTIIILGFLWVYFMICDYVHYTKKEELEEENRNLREEIKKLKR